MSGRPRRDGWGQVRPLSSPRKGGWVRRTPSVKLEFCCFCGWGRDSPVAYQEGRLGQEDPARRMGFAPVACGSSQAGSGGPRRVIQRDLGWTSRTGSPYVRDPEIEDQPAWRCSWGFVDSGAWREVSLSPSIIKRVTLHAHLQLTWDKENFPS